MLLHYSLETNGSRILGSLCYKLDADSFPTMIAHGNSGSVTHWLLPTQRHPVWKEVKVPDYFPGAYWSNNFADAMPPVVHSLPPSVQSTAAPLMPPAVSSWPQSRFHSVLASAPALTPVPVRQRVKGGSQTDPLGTES